jgi:glycosyltransferase involved in cell wall biosynthesis/capsular polysaccharide biosynthesis protein
MTLPLGVKDKKLKMPATPADPAKAVKLRDTRSGAQRSALTYIDVTDFALHLRHQLTLSGIQRVQSEIVRNLIDLREAEGVRFLALDGQCQPYEIETSALSDLIAYMGATSVTRFELDGRLDAILRRASASSIRRGDRFLTIGAFWNIRGLGFFLQALKNAGVAIGFFIHDILNITNPEYFGVPHTNKFVKGFFEATTYADFFLTTSHFNKAMLTKHLEGLSAKALPVEVVPLGHEFSIAEAAGPLSDRVAEIADSEFVLSVGTMEVRKNPIYLFNIWRMMIQAGRANIPKLVLAGRSGWLVQDFLHQIRACDHLGGRVVPLHGATDGELALLYRKCILTMFPSYMEGWGLPVGESLAHGKICIASNTSAIPEVGGDLADYVDPYNASEGLRVLSQYLDDPDLRRRREAEIVQRFKPRPWRTVAEVFLKAVQALAGQVRSSGAVAAISLLPGRFLPITSDGSGLLLNAKEGDLSAELICVSGWRLPELDGVWAKQPKAVIRFRADLPSGTTIHLLMRLRTVNGNACRVWIRSGSGAETVVSLVGAVDSLAVLSCEVEPDGLVTAALSLEGAHGESGDVGTPYWALRGISYMRAERLVREIGGKAHSDRTHSQAGRPTPRRSAEQPDPSERAPLRVGAASAGEADSRRAASLDEFLRLPDSYWPSSFKGHLAAPVLADRSDKQIFYEDSHRRVGPFVDKITYVRRSNQYVSTMRFSEGSIFDFSGVSRGLGYLKSSPLQAWLSRDQEGSWISAEAVAAAPRYDNSYLIFYNGNLHNYYHWMVESVLPLNVLSQALGPDSSLRIALPRSRHIAEVFDHSASLRAVGIDQYPIEEIAADLIKVREAVWVESDVIQSMPVQCLQDFRTRVAALHARSRLRKKRRLLVARKGPTRMIDNIRQVRSLLSRRGFETVYLEGMSVVDQIVLFQNAEFIVSPHGSGLANLMFCEPGTKVIELMPAVEMRPFFWLISEKLDLVHGMLFCGSANAGTFQDSMRVDVDKLDALLRMVESHR